VGEVRQCVQILSRHVSCPGDWPVGLVSGLQGARRFRVPGTHGRLSGGPRRRSLELPRDKREVGLVLRTLAADLRHDDHTP
jgi:hypothetical protein